MKTRSSTKPKPKVIKPTADLIAYDATCLSLDLSSRLLCTICIKKSDINRKLSKPGNTKKD